VVSARNAKQAHRGRTRLSLEVSAAQRPTVNG
jgi:hypothetical protein